LWLAEVAVGRGEGAHKGLGAGEDLLHERRGRREHKPFGNQTLYFAVIEKNY
jgi:hypothetical protein